MAQWLGELHISAAGISAGPRLPDRGPNHYLAHLQDSQTLIGSNLGHPAFSNADRALAEQILLDLAAIEARWASVGEICRNSPSAPVQGDLAPKNLQFRAEDGKVLVLPFDWEMSGWGVSAVDLEVLRRLGQWGQGGFGLADPDDSFSPARRPPPPGGFRAPGSRTLLHQHRREHPVRAPGRQPERGHGRRRNADAHQFIKDLPAGYDTLVGERGMHLSGGERQRISVARAFLKGGLILVLDETNAVGLQTEARILAAMERLMEGRTSFLIARGASTLQNCDLHLESRNGRIVEACPTPGSLTPEHPGGLR